MCTQTPQRGRVGGGLAMFTYLRTIMGGTRQNAYHSACSAICGRDIQLYIEQCRRGEIKSWTYSTNVLVRWCLSQLEST